MPDLDICLVKEIKQDVDILTKKLSNIVEDTCILSLPEDDSASLNEATSMKDELGNLTLKLIKLTHDREKRGHQTTEQASATCSSGVWLPKINVPAFDGKILSWKSFWEEVDATIHSKAGLIDIEKLMYLQDALKDRPARFIIQGLTWTSENYEEANKCFKERYNRPQLIQEEHSRSIVDAVPVKNGSEKELLRLYDAVTQHYWALKVVTVILQQKLDEKTQLKWAEFISHSKSVPPCNEFLKFLDLRARQLESVSHVGHEHTSGSDHKMLSVKPSYTISTDNACLACKKWGHRIHTCSVSKDGYGRIASALSEN